MKPKKSKNRKIPFFSLKNRYLAYILILLGGITADIGVLFINSEKKIMSVSLIVIGGLILFYSLYIIASDRFYIDNYPNKYHKI